MRSSSRAFTLLEVIVGASLTLLLFALFAEILVPSSKAYLRGTTRAGLEQGAMVAMERIVADLQKSTPRGVAVAIAPTVLGIDRIQTVADSGSQVWESKLVVYSVDTTSVLRRAECPPPAPFTSVVNLEFSPGSPYQASEDEMRSIAAENVDAQRVVARDVAEMTVQPTDDAGNPVTALGAPLTEALSITLRLQRREAHQGEPEVFTLTRVVSMKQRI